VTRSRVIGQSRKLAGKGVQRKSKGRNLVNPLENASCLFGGKERIEIERKKWVTKNGGKPQRNGCLRKKNSKMKGVHSHGRGVTNQGGFR